MLNRAPELSREAVSIAEAAAMAGLGRTKIYEAISKRHLQARKCGKRTIILRDDLRSYLANLPEASPKIDTNNGLK